MEPVDISFRVNDKDIEKASQRAVDSILGIGHAGEESVRAIKKQIKEQKELIAHVNKDVKEITEKFNKMVPGKQKDAFVGEVRAVKRALEEEKAVLKGLETQLDAAHDASRRLAFTKRTLTDQMMKLKLAGQEDSEAFRKLANEAAEVERAIRSVNKQMMNVGRADANFQGFVSGLSGVAGAFSAGAGAMALFGKESQDLQQVQTRLQALMAITIGLQQAYNSLNKNSAFQVNLLAKAKRAWAAAQDFLNIKLGIGIGLSKVFLATGVGLLIAGIGMLVAAYQRWVREQEEINTLQAELKSMEVETVKSMAKQTTEVRALIAVAKDYNASLTSRREAVRQLNELMPGYNAHINQEGKLVGDTDAALRKYLDTLYKVEKAKTILSNMSKAKAQLDELNVVGPESLSKMEKIFSGVAGIFSREKQAEMIAGFEDVKKTEFEGNKRALEAALKEMEGDFSKLLQDNTVFDALFGDEAYKNKQKRLSEQAKKAAEQLKKQQEKAEAEVNEELRRLAEKNITDRINLLEEGTQKELAKIRDKYNRTIAEADRLEKEWAEKQKKPLTEAQKKEIGEKKQIARDVRIQEEGRVIKALVDKYKDFAGQRLAIETKFNKDIAELEKQRIDALLSGNYASAATVSQAITQATKNKAKELTAFDFDLLKKNPDYVRAFEDLRSTSSETLSYLLEQFETFKEQAAESLDPTQLREYANTIQQIFDELTNRNPFKALAAAQDALRRAQSGLAVATASLNAARSSGDTEKITKAELEHRRALDEVKKANNDVEKAQHAVNVILLKSLDLFGKMGKIIGGQAGEIIGFIGEISSFVITSIEGIQAAARQGATALATIEKASAILGIIQLVMQLLSALDSLTDGAHKEYERLAEKQKQINLLSTAVNDYQLAVLKARNAEAGWFAEDKIRDLWHLREQGAKAYQSYVSKINEDQIRYVNKYSNKFKNLDEAIARYRKKNPGKRFNLDELKNETEKAVDNLRIETYKGRRGVFGIGRKSQRTEDLREWVKRELKTELFKDDGMLNKEAYDQILQKYGDKLVGETKETLEYLKKMQEEYEAYQQQLQEYVSTLYSPLLDNMTQAIWDWFDNGKNAMDQFREYSKDTFRNIANEMIKSLINKHVFDGVGKQLEKLHDDFFSKKISEKELYEGIAKTAETLDKTFEEKMPIIQKSMEALNGTLEKAGIDLYKPKQQAEKGFHTSVSQESFNEWLGQFVALRIHASNANVILTQAEASMRVMATHLFAIETNTRDTVQELREVKALIRRMEVEGVKMK